MIYNINIRITRASCCFNPLDELRIVTEHEVGDVQNLALLIVDPDGKGLRSDSHWQKTAYSQLVGCILHMCYKGQVEGTPGPLPRWTKCWPIRAGQSRTCGRRCLSTLTSTAEIILSFPPQHVT
jgi:hypothetical protein